MKLGTGKVQKERRALRIFIFNKNKQQVPLLHGFCFPTSFEQVSMIRG
jgi:hypothetical protein